METSTPAANASRPVTTPRSLAKEIEWIIACKTGTVVAEQVMDFSLRDRAPLSDRELVDVWAAISDLLHGKLRRNL